MDNKSLLRLISWGQEAGVLKVCSLSLACILPGFWVTHLCHYAHKNRRADISQEDTLLSCFSAEAGHGGPQSSIRWHLDIHLPACCWTGAD
jgi:hypothetical protein